MARTSMVALFVAALAVAGFAGLSHGQLLLDVLDGVSEDCKNNVLWFAANCTDDFAAAGQALEFEWPPMQALDVDSKKAKKYFKSIDTVADGCCKALCDLAQSKCMCDDDTYSSITETLFSDDGKFFIQMLEFGGNHCGHKPTVKNLGKTCKKAAKNKC